MESIRASKTRFERMPVDGRVYRVQWAGRLSSSKDGSTSLVEIFLQRQQLTTNGLVPDFEERTEADGSTRKEPIVEVIAESPGVIPAFWIGSLWQDGVLLAAQDYPGDVEKTFDIDLRKGWKIVYSDDLQPNAQGSSKRRYLLPPYLHALAGRSTSGSHHAFHRVPLVMCFDKCGNTVLLPCFEVFRRYFGVSSTLANALLSNHWEFVRSNLIDEKKSGFKGDSILVAPKYRLKDIGCCVIANFIGSAKGRAAAASVFLSIENQRRENRLGKPWITALPPFFSGRFRIETIGRQSRSNGPFLVLSIKRSTFPKLGATVTRWVEERVTNVREQDQHFFENLDTIEVPTKPIDGEASILPSEEVSATVRLHGNLTTGDAWEDQPTVHDAVRNEVVRSTRRKPRPNPKGGQVVSSPQRFTVKAVSPVDDLPKNKRAEITGIEHQAITSRFRALYDALRNLMAADTPDAGTKKRDRISGWQDVAIGKSRQLEFGIVSPLPTEVADQQIEWAIQHEANGTRPRYAWIVQVMFEGRPTYLIDIEERGAKGHRMLYFEFRRSPSDEKVVVHRMDGASIALAAMLVGLQPTAQRIGVIVDLGLDPPCGILRFNNGRSLVEPPINRAAG